MKNIIIYSIIAACLFMVGCSAKKGTTNVINPNESSIELSSPRIVGGSKAALAPIVIYKMRGDYANLVPITLSPDGKSVASYPGPSDVRLGDEYATPIQLNDGWWYDRRGVGMHSAFIRMTYPEYAALQELPSMAELMSLIVDRKPFTDLVLCDRSFFPEGVSTERLNAYIRAGMPGAKR